jgi:hypothetical protein
MLVGCRDTGINPTTDNHEFAIEGDTPIPNQITTVWWKQADSKQQYKRKDLNVSSELVGEIYSLLKEYTTQKKSPYAAFISKKKKKHKEDKKFKYRYFKLRPLQKAIEDANGEKKFYFHIFVDPVSNEVYQILAALVPDTPKQLQAVKEWGDKLNSNSKMKATAAPNYRLKSSCSIEEGLTWVPECGCFSPGTIEVCADSDDGGGGSGGGGGGEDTSDCYYETGGCEEDPGPDDPYGGDGGSGSTGSCLTGQVEDPNGNCVMGEIPCVGNPLKNPRIAAQTNSGIEGGRFRIGDDAVRDGRNNPHKGIDLKVAHGEAILSMYDGQVLRKAYEKDGWGQFIMVKYPNVNGKEVWTVYAHLNTISVEEGDPISPGTVLGTAGISGNLTGAIIDGYAIQHVHIETRIGGWSAKDPQNPEEYLTTQFDDNGNAVSGTDC